MLFIRMHTDKVLDSHSSACRLFQGIVRYQQACTSADLQINCSMAVPPLSGHCLQSSEPQGSSMFV